MTYHRATGDRRISYTVAPEPKLASRRWARDRVDAALRQQSGLGDRARNEYWDMNTFNPQRSLTLGQIELYLLFALALAGMITKMLEALTHIRGDLH
jgi:hypothetical protein